jgi:succinate-acetate transporter protein
VRAGGYLGLVVAAPAAHLCAAEVCEATYKRAVPQEWPLAKR